MVWSIIYYTIAVAYAIFAAFLSVVIVMENRNPVRTLAWILLLIALPIVGAVIYLFLGRDIRTSILLPKRLKPLEDYSTINEQTLHEHNVPVNFHKLIRLLDNNQHSRLYTDNKVEVYGTGKEIFETLFADLETATTSIHIEFYIIEEGTVGNQLHDILVRKAEQGVQVRVLYDAIGAMHLPIEWRNSLKSAGVKIAPFLSANSLSGLKYVNYRNHRKLVIIDGSIGYTGGINIADRYRLGNHLGLWRDTFVKIMGPAVESLQHAFLIDWNFANIKEFLPLPEYVAPCEPKEGDEMAGNDQLIQLITSGPDSYWPHILNGILSAINNARECIYIHTPYFIPPETLRLALESAALSGVDVRLMMAEQSDSIVVSTASRSYIEPLLRAGVKVYFYRQNFLHSKAVVIDNYLSIIGTANMDIRSFEQNFEVATFIYGQSTAEKLTKNFLQDEKSCRQLNMQSWRQRTMARRMYESFARLLSPLF